MSKISVRDIAFIAMLTCILFVQEEALTFLPNIQLSVFLIVLYSKKMGLLKTSIIVTIHVILDNIVMGSFNLLTVPFMLLGWMVIPLTIHFFFKKVENPIILAFLGIMYSIIYSWIFIIPNVLILEVDFMTYFLADIPFELLLSLSSFLSILWLYEPCSKIFDKYIINKDTQLGENE